MAIAMNVEERCQCGLTQDQITSSAFQCFPDSPQAVTYRAVLHGTTSAFSADIISHIEQWVSEGVTISIQNVLIDIDTNCVIEITSNRDRECGVTEESTVVTVIAKGSSRSTPVGGIVGGMISMALISILIVVIIVSMSLFLKWRKTKINNYCLR